MGISEPFPLDDFGGAEASQERNTALSAPPERYRVEADSAPVAAGMPSQFYQEPTALADDMRAVIQALRRRAWLIFAVLIFVVALAAAYIYVATQLFTGSATVVLDSRRQIVTNSPEVLPDVEPDSMIIDTQVQLIESRAVLGMAADDLLTAQVVPQGHHNKILAWFHDAEDRSADATPTRDDLIDLLGDNLNVERVSLTSALQISYTNPDPEVAAKVANSIAGAYIEYQTTVKQQATKDANQWLKVRVSDLKKQVETAEAAVDSYRARSGLLLAKGTTSTESQLSNVDSGLNEARQALSESQARLSAYRTALDTSGAAEAAKIVASPSMQQLRGQFTSLESQKALLSPTFGPLHPQTIELNKQLDSLQEQINAEAHRTVDELTNDVRIAENKVQGLSSMRDESRKELATDNAASVGLSQLQSNADSLRQIYEGTLSRLQQTTAQETLSQVSAAVISEATVPTDPSAPRKKIILGAACAAGLALGTFAALILQLFSRTNLRPRDFERRTGVPLLALVPKLRKKDLRIGGKRVPITEIVRDKPMSLFAEAFRNLRLGIRGTAGQRSAMVVQITSGSFAEGKTVSSVAFAQTAAMDGRRVLLIDADVRCRSLTTHMGISTQTGLMEVLRGTAVLRDALVYGGAERRPHILPLSTAAASPHDRFAGRTFESLLEKLRAGFDLIVIDSAPVLAVSDSLALAKRVDAVVLIAKWGKTPTDVVLRAIHEINRVGGHVAGTVLTHVNMKRVIGESYGRSYYPTLLKYYS